MYEQIEFVVEDGTGLSNATSFCSLDFADTFLTLGGKRLEWMIMPTTSREEFLIQASYLLDEQYKWKGQRTVSTSGLRWPRSGVRDRDGIPFDQNEIPLSLQKATAVLAYHLSRGFELQGTPGAGLTRLRVDVIDLRFDHKTAEHPFPAEIRSLLGEIGTLPTGRKRFIQSEIY